MRKISFRLLGVPAAAALIAGKAWAQTGYSPLMMWPDGGWSMFFFGPLFMIITLVALVAAVVLVVRWLGGLPSGARP